MSEVEITQPITVYVVKLVTTGGVEYCRFASYSECTLVDHPLKATIYRRKQDADKRASEEHWVGENCIQPKHFSVSAVRISSFFLTDLG